MNVVIKATYSENQNTLMLKAIIPYTVHALMPQWKMGRNNASLALGTPSTKPTAGDNVKRFSGTEEHETYTSTCRQITWRAKLYKKIPASSSSLPSLMSP